jgi:hypothetical protein
MEETPAVQYIFAPAVPIYHLSLSAGLSLCMSWLVIDPQHDKRRDDWRTVTEKPEGRFRALCSECERRASGKPKLESPSLELLSPHSLIEIP